MVDIAHRVGINAPSAQVYQALATAEGVAAWWAEDTTGDRHPDGTVLDTGRGRPSPHDVKIDNWN